MPVRVASTYSAARPGATAVARRVPPLTARDRARIASHGRPGLLRRLRLRASAAWVAVAGSTVLGMTTLATSPIEDDTGMWIVMASLPLMVVAAHQQSTLQRIRLNDPSIPIPITPATAGRHGTEDTIPEVADLALVRDRLLGALPALDAKFPTVAAEVRAADQRAHAALEVQGQALVALRDLPLAGDVESAAQDEIRHRMRAGIQQYQDLLAECVLLLARSDASGLTDGSLARARDLVATHSEGLRVAEGLDGP